MFSPAHPTDVEYSHGAVVEHLVSWHGWPKPDGLDETLSELVGLHRQLHEDDRP